MESLGWRVWIVERVVEGSKITFFGWTSWLESLGWRAWGESLGCRACGEELEKLYFLVGHLGVDVERWF